MSAPGSAIARLVESVVILIGVTDGEAVRGFRALSAGTLAGVSQSHSTLDWDRESDAKRWRYRDDIKTVFWWESPTLAERQRTQNWIWEKYGYLVAQHSYTDCDTADRWGDTSTNNVFDVMHNQWVTPNQKTLDLFKRGLDQPDNAPSWTRRVGEALADTVIGVTRGDEVRGFQSDADRNSHRTLNVDHDVDKRWRYRRDLKTVFWWEPPTLAERQATATWLTRRFNYVVKQQSYVDADLANSSLGQNNIVAITHSRSTIPNSATREFLRKSKSKSYDGPGWTRRIGEAQGTQINVRFQLEDGTRDTVLPGLISKEVKPDDAKLGEWRVTLFDENYTPLGHTNFELSGALDPAEVEADLTDHGGLTELIHFYNGEQPDVRATGVTLEPARRRSLQA